MANIQLNWSGATASNGIQGYEISYKESTGSTYTNLPFITSSATTGSYTWTSAALFKDYNFRIRTKDNENLFSSYKTFNLSTSVTSPNTVDSYILIYNNESEIGLEFSGATDDYGIKGHEVSYKRTIDSIYTTLPFITTSNGYFSIVIDSLVQSTDYDIRVRTQNIYDIWSSTYFNITEETLSGLTSSVSRSITSANSGSACALTITSNYLYYSGIISNGNIFYTDSALTTPYAGSNRVWHVGNIDESYSVKISNSGVMSEVSLCL